MSTDCFIIACKIRSLLNFYSSPDITTANSYRRVRRAVHVVRGGGDVRAENWRKETTWNTMAEKENNNMYRINSEGRGLE